MAASFTIMPGAALRSLDSAPPGPAAAETPSEPSMPAGLTVAALGKCATGLTIAGTDLCTHGPDPVPDWIKKRGGPRLVQPTAVGATAAVGCDGDGVTGKRVQALYLYVTGRPNRLSTYRDSMRSWAAYVDSMFNNSAKETGGNARLRWVTSECLLDIVPVEVPAAAEIDFGAMVSGLTVNGYASTDRKYLVWFDSNPNVNGWLRSGHDLGRRPARDDKRQQQSDRLLADRLEVLGLRRIARADAQPGRRPAVCTAFERWLALHR